jgi:hypothetical protein
LASIASRASRAAGPRGSWLELRVGTVRQYAGIHWLAGQ